MICLLNFMHPNNVNSELRRSTGYLLHSAIFFLQEPREIADLACFFHIFDWLGRNIRFLNIWLKFGFLSLRSGAYSASNKVLKGKSQGPTGPCK